MQSAALILRPHIEPILADCTWTEGLAAQGPALTINEDVSAPWALSNPHLTPASPSKPPSHVTSSGHVDQDNKVEAEETRTRQKAASQQPPGMEAEQARAGHEAAGQQSSSVIEAALAGLVRLNWLMLCRGKLAQSWAANMSQAQKVLESGKAEVSTCTWLADVHSCTSS